MICKAFKLVVSVIFSLCIFIMNINEVDVPPNFSEPVYTQSYALTDELFRGQGVTTNGEYYYFSSNYGLMKTKLDAVTVVRQNLVSIPFELLIKGCNHIGGITYCNGKIYAPVESSKSKDKSPIYMMCFDANTLKLLNYKLLDSNQYMYGVPFCIADPSTGIIYTAGNSDFDHMHAYDENMNFLYTVNIESKLDKIQGGDVYNGILYCASSRNGQSIYAVNLSTGQTKKIIDRNLFGSSEGEDLTVLPTQDGTFFHVLDIGDVRIGGHFRHYAFDPNSLVW